MSGGHFDYRESNLEYIASNSRRIFSTTMLNTISHDLWMNLMVFSTGLKRSNI